MWQVRSARDGYCPASLRPLPDGASLVLPRRDCRIVRCARGFSGPARDEGGPRAEPYPRGGGRSPLDAHILDHVVREKSGVSTRGDPHTRRSSLTPDEVATPGPSELVGCRTERPIREPRDQPLGKRSAGADRVSSVAAAWRFGTFSQSCPVPALLDCPVLVGAGVNDRWTSGCADHRGSVRAEAPRDRERSHDAAGWPGHEPRALMSAAHAAASRLASRPSSADLA